MNTILRMAMLRTALMSPVVDLGAAQEAASAINTESPEDVELRKARLKKAEEDARKQATDETQVPDTLLGLAQREIKDAWKEFSGKGGAWEHMQKAREKLVSISGHILNIAREACKAAHERMGANPDGDELAKLASRLFRNAMAQAELSLRATLDLTDAEAETKLDAFLNSSWAVYKSKARKGLEGGFDARDFDTLNQLDKAVQQAKTNSNTGTRNDGKGKDAPTDNQIKTQAMDASELVAKGSGKVQGAVTQFLLAVRSLHIEDGSDNEEKVIGIINNATRELNKLTMGKEGEKVSEPAAKPAREPRQARA